MNGALKQHFWANDMIFDIANLVSYISEGLELLPGDIILTGTGPGVGLWRDPPEFLMPGDVIEIESVMLGTLTTPTISSR